MNIKFHAHTDANDRSLSFLITACPTTCRSLYEGGALT